MVFAHWFLLFCIALNLYGTGVIWQAQRVSYPLFGMVGSKEYIPYHKFYSSRIPLPVIIPGFACFFANVALVFLRPEPVPLSLALVNAACGIVGLLVTIVLEIPRHARLEKWGKSEALIRELILYNWPRTLSITGSAFLTLWMLTLSFMPA